MKTQIIIGFICALSYFNAHGHVQLNNPQGNEEFTPGEIVEISWEEIIPHNTLNWDLYFSSDDGVNWDTIQLDIPLQTLSYQWEVPVLNTNLAKIRIIQDNQGTDYGDISEVFSISIVSDLEELADNQLIKVFPNPAKFGQMLSLQNLVNNCSVHVLSSNGKVTSILLVGMNTQMQIDPKLLSPGINFLIIQKENGQQIIKKIILF